VRRLRRVSVVKLSKVSKDCYCKDAQSRKNSTLRRVRGLPQGVRARVFVETQNCVKLRRDKSLKLIEEKHWKSVCEVSKIGGTELHRR
jgi:hypothetical protein